MEHGSLPGKRVLDHHLVNTDKWSMADSLQIFCVPASYQHPGHDHLAAKQHVAPKLLQHVDNKPSEDQGQGLQDLVFLYREKPIIFLYVELESTLVCQSSGIIFSLWDYFWCSIVGSED